MNRRDFLKKIIQAVLGLSSLPFLSSQITSSTQKRKPNIIFILSDDLGYGDLGCYGQEKIKTPYLDQMAKEGVRFTQHYAGSAICAPSRCSLLTGQHTGHTEIRGNINISKEGQLPISDSTITVAELLKKAGYHTAVIGKWGLGAPESQGVPDKQGFDYFYGFLDQKQAHSYYPRYLYENQKKVFLKNRPKWKRKEYSHDLFTEKAVEYIKSHQKDPFFLYLAYTIPHAELAVPFSSLKKYLGKFRERPHLAGYYRVQPMPRAAYAAMVSRMDRDIGRLFALLKELNLDEDTIVFFSSDNGPHNEGGNTPKFFNSSGPFRGIKRSLNEGGIRVPLLVRWPNSIQGGQVSDHISAFWDFMPTVCDIAAIDVPDQSDGISYLPALLQQSQQKHPYLYWEIYARDVKRAVRIGSFKAIQEHTKKNPDGPIFLYDILKDPEEMNDLSDQYPEIISQVKTIFSQSHTPYGQFHFNNE